MVSNLWSLLGDIASSAFFARLSPAAKIPFQTRRGEKVRNVAAPRRKRARRRPLNLRQQGSAEGLVIRVGTSVPDDADCASRAQGGWGEVSFLSEGVCVWAIAAYPRPLYLSASQSFT